MKILVTGSTGYIGSAVVAALERSHAGHDIVRAGRSADIDIARPETLAPLVAEADVVVHAAIDSKGDAAGTDRRFVESVIAILRTTRGLRRFVYTSGLWVLGDSHGQLFDETTTPAHPATVVAWRPSVERLIEDATARGDVDGFVVRPAIVYGGTGGLVGAMSESLARTGSIRIVGAGDNHWPLVHRADLGDLYARVVERAPSQRILHGTDGSNLTVRAIAETIIRASGKSGSVLSIPIDEARSELGAFADALALDQRVSSERTQRALGISPSPRGFDDR